MSVVQCFTYVEHVQALWAWGNKVFVTHTRGVARIESKGRQKEISDQGFLRLARKARARRAHPRGVWGQAPPETFWISDLLRSLLVQSGCFSRAVARVKVYQGPQKARRQLPPLPLC